jgi:hypothetical protein
VGLVGKYGPPEPANVCQLQEGIHAFPGARGRDKLEDLEEDFDGDFASEGLRSVGLGIT